MSQLVQHDKCGTFVVFEMIYEDYSDVPTALCSERVPAELKTFPFDFFGVVRGCSRFVTCPNFSNAITWPVFQLHVGVHPT